MLSTENPSDPSCSSRTSALKSDEKASDHKLAFQEAEPAAADIGETQLHSFSIRNHVFKSRNKDIRTNWPFAEQFLKLCLNHGIKDFLPPFERPNLVRAKCCKKGVESEQVTECLEAGKVIGNGGIDSIRLMSCFPSDQLVGRYRDRLQDPLPEEGDLKVHQEGIFINKRISRKAEIISTVTSHGLIEGLIEGEVEVAKSPSVPEKPEITSEPSEKKYSLEVKLSTVTETSEREDLISTLSTFSDSMASKVCPVCKTFTSTSNTTLNAHIDQCLSSECDIKEDVNKFPKFIVKPRKKRLIVDIYTTACHCTLEDLDRRNGTNWATDLTPAAQPTEVGIEIKRPRLSPVVSMDSGNEGEVYVDSNGTKLRILSTFKEAPPVILRKDFKIGKHAKGIKAGRKCMVTKKKHFKSKYSKLMKMNPQNKRLRPLKSFKKAVQTTTKGECDGGIHPEKKQESTPQLVNTQNQNKISELATLRPWVCSKRSDLSNKVKQKDTDDISEKARNLLVETSSSPISNRILRFSRSSDASVSSQKTKRVDALSNTGQAVDDGMRVSLKSSNLNSKLPSEDDSLAGCLEDKLSRSVGSFLLSPRIKMKKFNIGSLQISDIYSGTGTTPSKSFNLPLKARKSSKQKKIALLQGSSFSLETSIQDGSNNPTEKLPMARPVLESSKWEGEMNLSISGRLQKSTKDSGLNSPGAEVLNRNHQYKFAENVTRSNISKYDHEKEELDIIAPVCQAKLAPSRSVEDHEALISGSTNQTELFDRKSVNQQVTIRTNIQTEGAKVKPRGDEDPISVKCGEYQANSISIREPNPSVSRQGMIDIEVAREKSSTTSARSKTDRAHNFATDMEPSTSPVSTTSTISPQEQSAKPTSTPDKSSSVMVRNDQNIKAKEPRCSCSESLSRESQLSRQRSKHISNLYIRPAFSFASSCLNLETPTVSILTKASSDYVVKTPSSCSGFGSSNPCSQAIQTSSSPTLRLMGKDVVLNKEELFCNPGYSPNPSYLPIAFSSRPSISNHGSFSHSNLQIQSGSSVLGQAPLLGNHQIPLQSYPKRPSKGPNSQSPWRMDRMIAPYQQCLKPIPSSRAPYATQEVIVIDDTHGLEVVPNGSMASPMVTTSPLTLPNSSLMPQRSISFAKPLYTEGSQPLLSKTNDAGKDIRRFDVPSTMFAAPLYYSQTFR